MNAFLRMLICLWVAIFIADLSGGTTIFGGLIAGVVIGCIGLVGSKWVRNAKE